MTILFLKTVLKWIAKWYGRWKTSPSHPIQHNNDRYTVVGVIAGNVSRIGPSLSKWRRNHRVVIPSNIFTKIGRPWVADNSWWDLFSLLYHRKDKSLLEIDLFIVISLNLQYNCQVVLYFVSMLRWILLFYTIWVFIRKTQ